MGFALGHLPRGRHPSYAASTCYRFRTFTLRIHGYLQATHNFSERELRREAIGRKNWLFLGSDDAGDVNATFVSLLASSQLHQIEPWAYLRDLLCLLPDWPASRVLELSPLHWQQTLQQEQAQQRLAANVFRQVALGLLKEKHLPAT